MPQRRLSMRTVPEVLRLKWASGLANRDIAACCRTGETTVRCCIRRAELAGVWTPSVFLELGTCNTCSPSRTESMTLNLKPTLDGLLVNPWDD